MTTYLAYNDESEKSNKNYPYRLYTRLTILVKSEDLINIEKKIQEIKGSYFDKIKNLEIKWQYVWCIKKYFNNKTKNINNKNLLKIIDFLEGENKGINLLFNYCQDLIKILENYNLKIIITFTENREIDLNLLKFHIQDHLERVQMEIQKEKDNTGIFIYDSVDENKKKLIKEIYKEIIEKDKFVKEYFNISKTLLFDESYDNHILQLTDFITGIIQNSLYSKNIKSRENYSFSIDLFKKYIYKKIRNNNKNEIWGYGIKEVPKDKDLRREFKEYFEQILGDTRK